MISLIFNLLVGFMTDLIRCNSCRGRKKVIKLGGIEGDCDTCKGNDKIKACDKVLTVIQEQPIVATGIISQVADCVPVTPKSNNVDPIEAGIVKSKPNLYKRKAAK